ncbi:hypothetical protein BJ912DRAFT_943050 [Pholiota molesta]|nr:hypothetical protein BJ912DRAFT_943050 [Pholiota molesta]
MEAKNTSSGLAVTQPNSPGSSVFDLPIQPTNPGANTSNDASQRQFPIADVDRRDFLVGADQPSCVLISGGTGGNAICSAFVNACYILPVSDDGGSSSEIIRVLGGPSIGDIRSRLVRLIPPAPETSPSEAIRRLLAYRLPSISSEREARDEWRDIVEGRSKLWKGIPSDRKETIRGFLVYFESELLKRAHKNFDFRNGSIGNYFLAAAQGFFRSLPSAIFLFSSITNSQADGERLVGQCEISHPMPVDYPVEVIDEETPVSPVDGLGEFESSSSPRQNMLFESLSKGTYEPLPARIQRLYYINGYGMEIHPSPNGEFLSNLASRDVLVYSCGSLWTSIIPCLALKGVAAQIARSHSLRAKVLLLNVENDRETDGYTAADYIRAIVETLNSNYSERAYGLGSANTTYPISAFITDLVYLKGGRIKVDVKAITVSDGGTVQRSRRDSRFDADAVALAMKQVWADVN